MGIAQDNLLQARPPGPEVLAVAVRRIPSAAGAALFRARSPACSPFLLQMWDFPKIMGPILDPK